MNTEPHALDVAAPDKIAQLVEAVGIRKVGLGSLPTLTLGVLPLRSWPSSLTAAEQKPCRPVRSLCKFD